MRLIPRAACRKKLPRMQVVGSSAGISQRNACPALAQLRFKLPLHAEFGVRALHEPTLVWSPAFRRLRVAKPAEAGTPCGQKFKVPMRAKNRNGAFHEPYEFRARARIESGGGPPHFKTLARWPESLELPPGFGVRRPCAALAFQDRFMVPMHGKHAQGAFHEPRSSNPNDA